MGQHCTISPSRFPAECHKKRLNQGSFVLLCFAFLWVVLIFCSVSIFNLSSVLYFPACTNMNVTA